MKKKKTTVGSSKFRSAHASKRPKIRAMRMTGEGSGYARGNKSSKKRSPYR